MAVTADFAELLGPELSKAIDQKGFTDLTPVQKAVLAPALRGRDLRVTSQTGSGKTVAIGFMIRELVVAPSELNDKIAHPRALVIAPTRELAKQMVQELTWLFAPLGAKVASVTGGASFRDEHRSLAARPAVVVGTPGRLLDHLTRGSIVCDEVGAIVLDEADRMLDLGFRDELEAILGKAPEGHQTHLVSATFPREVEALAAKVQNKPARVEGTRLGAANVDIDHVVHVVEPRQRLDTVINLLLANPDAQTLLFTRTRADVTEVAEKLADAGFGVGALSGEMEQRERDRALAAFKRGDARVLVATDVAARGIDVQDIAMVIHLEPPTDPDSYIHRSGRTGRAGRKGRSVLLVVPSAVRKTQLLLQRAKVSARPEPVPTAEDIRKNADQRIFEALTREDDIEVPLDARKLALAERLAAREDSVRTMARLLTMARSSGPTEPRDVRKLDPNGGGGGTRGSYDRGPAPERSYGSERSYGASERGGLPLPVPRRVRDDAGEDRRPPRRAADNGDFVPFRVSWGGEQGADARKIMAMACRWGNIRGTDLGPIEIEGTYSIIGVASHVAETFAQATSEPDARNPRVTIRPEGARAAGPARHEERPARAPRREESDATPSAAPAPAHGHATKKHAAERPVKREVRPYVREARPPVREARSATRDARPAPREAVRPAAREARPAARDARPAPRAHGGPARDAAPRDPTRAAYSRGSARLVQRREAPPREAVRTDKPAGGALPPRKRRIVTR